MATALMRGIDWLVRGEAKSLLRSIQTASWNRLGRAVMRVAPAAMHADAPELGFVLLLPAFFLLSCAESINRC